MACIENTFSIKRITKSTDESYIEALKIYNETTPVDIKTNSNEITYWLDNPTFSTKFELLLFALYLDGKVVGFAMLSYLTERRVLVHDYLQLKDFYRVNAAFFAFISLIYTYANSEGYKTNFYVTEIGNKNEGKEVDKESVLFHKLLCLEGFGFVNAKHRVLPLGADNHESNYDAWIYIKKSGDTMASIARDTFLSIVKGIYFDYYETWYSVFLNAADMDSFRKSINWNLEEVEKKIGTSSTLEIVNVSAECAMMPIQRNERTDGSLPARKRDVKKMLPLMAITLVLAPIVVVICYNWILNQLDIPISSVSSIIGSVFAAIMALITAFLMTRKRES